MRTLTRASVCRVGAVSAGLVWALLAAADARQLPAPSAGERFYREGLTADGAAVDAVVQQDIRVRSTAMPCVNCHRRSGFGTAEGPVTTPSVTGPALFAPVTRGIAQMGTVRTTGAGTRPAYTEQSLLRAVREGVDPAGRTLLPTMPRYAFSDETGSALAAYLRLLSADRPAGVTADSIRLATVTTPGVNDAKRASMLAVLETYVRHKNANTRNETGRRERGPWDMAGHVEKYRNWVLDEWRLTGAPSEWPAQLADLYRRAPVFALLSGLGDDDWQPIHEFSEHAGIPVILPQVANAPSDGAGGGFYSMYFSKGLGLEVELLAHQLQGLPAARVLQVARCGSAGDVAAKAMKKLAAAIETECVDGGKPFTSGEWKRMLARRHDTLVLWLAPADLTATAENELPGAITHVYVSSTLLGDGIRALPERIASRSLVLHPFVLPDERDQHAFRAITWLKANALAPADRDVAINALYAAALVNDGLSHPRTLESREYFVERLEHLASRSPHRSTYPAVAFGPQRRIGSAGGYVLKAPIVSGGPFGKVAEWFVPSP